VASPAKRCCLSLPASPSSETSAMHRAMVAKRTRVWNCDQLADYFR